MLLIGESLLVVLYNKQDAVILEDFCNDIVESGESMNISKAEIQEGNNANRSSEVSWLDDNKLKQNLREVIQIANQQTGWNFALTEFEPLQYTLYKENDYYDWHIDSHNKPYDNGLIRKLSFTLCLNEDYEGGDFSFSTPHPINTKTHIETIKKPKKGTMIVFPSYTWHKVDKVTSGIRKTLVGWVVGKQWS
jgi:PKHD-type hydroxylase